MKIQHFREYKVLKKKITMITCYDSTSAKIAELSDVDVILIGDSGAMTMQGYDSTLPATTEMIAAFTKAVASRVKDKFIVADVPFLASRKGLLPLMDCVQALMTAGAHAVKIEGAKGHLDLIRHIVDSGVPVIGHLGLTPQSIHQLGGYKVQGRGETAAENLLIESIELEKAGCCALVLECVPTQVGKAISEKLEIPTIGIGAGPYCDGQVLVWQDLLGMNTDFKPKFVRTYLNGAELIKNALNSYNADVKEGKFPLEKESFE